MAYFTLQEAREAFERRQRGRTVRKTASQVLNEEVASVRDTDRFDIFLSHCVKGRRRDRRRESAARRART
jgi:hypothetical protein